jgi:long-chain fatty acid transport protein
MSIGRFYYRCITLVFVLIIPSWAFAHGWAGFEQGAKAHGMGGAFSGLADDATAAYYNPAGITQLEGTQISVGFALPTINGKFKSAGTSGIPGASAGDETDLESQTFFIPNFYLTSKMNDKLSLGFGAYTIFGIGFEWPDSFEGRFAPGGKKAELTTLTLSPVAAYQVNDKLSLSLGARVEQADLKLENKIFVAPGVPEVSSEISGDDYGYGWHAAMLYKFSDNFSLGLNYRSKINHSFDDLDVNFSPQISNIGPIPVGLTNTKADLDVDLPQIISLGAAWLRGPLTLTFDVYWWNWSTIEELKFLFKEPVAGQTSMTLPLSWEDTWTYAIGMEYVIKAFNRDISLRGGFMYEQCPVPDETVSPVGFQGDNLLYNIGLGSKIGPVYFDFFFTYVQTKDRTWNNNDTGNAPNPGGGPITGEFSDYNTTVFGSNITFKF